MLLALFFLLYSDTIDPPTRYDGRAGKLTVRVPRLEVEPAIDGKLDEPVWGEAALLTGFSQFSPADGVPAADSTEVLVWYSPTAILFGIRAFEAHGAVHATWPTAIAWVFRTGHLVIFAQSLDTSPDVAPPAGVRIAPLSESGWPAMSTLVDAA